MAEIPRVHTLPCFPVSIVVQIVGGVQKISRVDSEIVSDEEISRDLLQIWKMMEARTAWRGSQMVNGPQQCDKQSVLLSQSDALAQQNRLLITLLIFSLQN